MFTFCIIFVVQSYYKMLRFISFGSGSSGNCYFLYTDTDGIMIDCGVGVRKLKKYFHDYGLHISDIHNILVTHDHADHVKSVGSVCSDNHLPVYSTLEVHQGIYRNWCVKNKIDDSLKRFLTKGETIKIGEFAVTPFAVPHDSADNVGYCIEYSNIVFTIITDCGHITEEIKKYIRKSNYLVIEANHGVEKLRDGKYPEILKRRIASDFGHLSNEDCAAALVENATLNLRKVWLCHLSDENNHPELARKTVEGILRDHGIVIGKEFDMEVLRRKAPNGVYELSL